MPSFSLFRKGREPFQLATAGQMIEIDMGGGSEAMTTCSDLFDKGEDISLHKSNRFKRCADQALRSFDAKFVHARS